MADTHVLVWYLPDSGKLSAAAHRALEASRTIVATAIAMDAAAVSADDRLRTAGEQRVLTVIW